MAFVVPIIAAYGAATAAGVTMAAALTGAAGFATFAAVAGGFMASAGMLTGNKTLTKIGGILSLTGGIVSVASSLANGASGAASAGAAEGAAADAIAGQAAEEGANAALQNELANTAVGETIGQTAGGEAASQAGNTLSQAGQTAAEAAQSGGSNALTLNSDPYMSALDQSGQNLMDQARLAKTLPVQDAGVSTLADGSDYGLMARNAATPSGLTQGMQDSALSRIAEAGQQIKDKTALDTILDKIGGVGRWVKDNKELVQVGGQMLGSGMQSYQQGQQFDAQMNLLAQRRARLNQPVVLGIQAPQLKMITPGG